MVKLTPVNQTSSRECLESKIRHHINKLDEYQKDQNQKILELCQVGKVLCTYFPAYSFKEIREVPDFIITDGINDICIEHELILQPEKKKRIGFLENTALLAERELYEDEDFPKFHADCRISDSFKFRTRDKQSIIDTFINVIRHKYLTGKLLDNELIERITFTKHSQKTISLNFGAYMVSEISESTICEFISKKEQKIDKYIENTGLKQWLILIIGNTCHSSYEVFDPFNVVFKSKFDKIFLLEDFDNVLYELK
ncbi:hypothetical protein [Flammeovirga sp. SJP92]|uniref:hypothetical protein n=1 Tax=Flammeovirga sp. SJP92 TaxID=1775430 RepID=UPI0007892AF7|nr:hypothetical protein [Flammeovirga sp. SJP92]KXX66693.1 hypothetical protein AVL50_31110 [Flammeovirga sp. SJP92]